MLLEEAERIPKIAILYLLPERKTFIYKVLMPFDNPLLMNLIYICYQNFKELIFFKPVQNFHSQEIYIIGKGYLGTTEKVMERLLFLYICSYLISQEEK